MILLGCYEKNSLTFRKITCSLKINQRYWSTKLSSNKQECLDLMSLAKSLTSAGAWLFNDLWGFIKL